MKNQKNMLIIALDLGSAYLVQNEQVITECKATLSTEDINSLWNEVNRKRPNYEGLEGVTEPLNRLKEVMIDDEFYLQKISSDVIVAFGKDPECYLLAFQMLVRKNKEQLFPVEAIIALGKENETIAEDLLEKLSLLKELEGKKEHYYEISTQWAKSHSALCAKISKKWQNDFDLYILTVAEQEAVKKGIVELKEYDEFKDLYLNTRENRDAGPVNCEQVTSTRDALMALGVGATFVASAVFLRKVSPSMLSYGMTLGATVLSSFSLFSANSANSMNTGCVSNCLCSAAKCLCSVAKDCLSNQMHSKSSL